MYASWQVCKYASMHFSPECKFVGMRVACARLCMYVGMYVSMYVCHFAIMYVFMYVCMYIKCHFSSIPFSLVFS